VAQDEERKKQANEELRRRIEAFAGESTDPAAPAPKYTEIGSQVAQLLGAAEQIREKVADEAAEIRLRSETEAAEATKRLA
jgi:cell division septum initiation protein DivIVA